MDTDDPARSSTRANEITGTLDRIHITGLLLRCIVGINPDERENKQDVVIDITLFADLSKAGASDNIDDTVNYRTIKNRVVALVESSSFFLVEKLAEEIARECLVNPMVEAVKVSVEKPGALRFARSVGVELLRLKAQ
ncbi:MAG TPA: dihydroneopterin aldolase [Spirochaetia bacterium]|nr:dihydroneopterin aldolase [Spirochaetia bacterium]